jgi:hypothetical protein
MRPPAQIVSGFCLYGIGKRVEAPVLPTGSKPEAAALRLDVCFAPGERTSCVSSQGRFSTGNMLEVGSRAVFISMTIEITLASTQSFR